jgi:hypothetical protein
VADICTSLDRARGEIIIINLKTIPFLVEFGRTNELETRDSSVGIVSGATGWTVLDSIPCGEQNVRNDSGASRSSHSMGDFLVVKW